MLQQNLETCFQLKNHTTLNIKHFYFFLFIFTYTLNSLFLCIILIERDFFVMLEKDLESKEKITVDIQKLERNLKQVEDITFVDKEKEVYDRAVDYMNDSKYYLEKDDMRTAFGCIEYSHGLLDALRMIHGLI